MLLDVTLFVFFLFVDICLSLLQLGIVCVGFLVDLVTYTVGARVNKTRTFFRKLKNMFWSKYELSFKQETLFQVRLQRDGAWGPTFHSVGTVKPGTFDYVLEPIEYSRATVVNTIEIVHMSLATKVIHGPIHMMPRDVLQLCYSKKLTY